MGRTPLSDAVEFKFCRRLNELFTSCWTLGTSFPRADAGKCKPSSHEQRVPVSVVGQESDSHLLRCSYEELDQFPVEFLRRLFIRQVSHVLESHQAAVAKILTQGRGRAERNRAIPGPPHQKGAMVANLRQSSFEFRQVSGPCPDDLLGIAKTVVLAHWPTVAFKGVGRNFRGVAENSAEPEVVKKAPVSDCVTEQV